jgi:hypothetical protein
VIRRGGESVHYKVAEMRVTIGTCSEGHCVADVNQQLDDRGCGHLASETNLPGGSLRSDTVEIWRAPRVIHRCDARDLTCDGQAAASHARGANLVISSSPDTQVAAGVRIRPGQQNGLMGGGNACGLNETLPIDLELAGRKLVRASSV